MNKIVIIGLLCLTAGGAMAKEYPGKKSEKELQQQLTPLEYQVTQEAATEKPFANKYWNNKRAGIYVDVASGEPLFSSLDKYDSGSGWPSFTKPIDAHYIQTRGDDSLFLQSRTEVLSHYGKSHLGHVFNDGPQHAGGMRYCINSAALRFVPVEDLKKEGYGRFLPMFDRAAKK